MNLSDKVEVKNARYYNLINVRTQKSLYLGSGCKDFKAEKIMMDDLNPQSLGQVWMIFQVDHGGILRPDCYQIVHTRSTLVLNRCKDTFFGKLKNFVAKTQPNEMRLAFGDWSPQQMFYLEHPNIEDHPNYLRFRSYENASQYLFYDKFLKCQLIDPKDQRCWWEVQPCFGNPIINRSCYFQNAFSTLVMDVPGASHDTGQTLIQYPLNNRFNQRFNLSKTGKYYRISNLHSRLYISASKKAVAGQYITQQKKSDEMWQLWVLEYQGKNIYLIRSALAKNLFLGTKDNDINPKSKIILTDNQDFGLWKIVGFLPK